jgi:molecular chaperone DnaK (HSP70)
MGSVGQDDRTARTSTTLTDPEYTMFLNLGHSTFQASVVSYIQGNLRVKAATVGRNLGSREFDLALANKLGEQFAFAERFKAWPRPTSTPSASPTTRTSTTPCPSST